MTWTVKRDPKLRVDDPDAVCNFVSTESRLFIAQHGESICVHVRRKTVSVSFPRMAIGG